MKDALAQLAAANPVDADELAPLELPARVRREPSSRLVLAVAAVSVAAFAAALIGVFAFRGSHPVSPPTSAQGPTGPNGPEMLRHPLGSYSNRQVTLPEAAVALGQPVVLPDTSLVGPGDVGTVWANTGPSWAKYHPTEGHVAVTFPVQRVLVDYKVPYLGSASAYASDAKAFPEFSAIELSGTPALAISQNPEEQRFGLIEFGVGGLGIQVWGPYDQATLESIAQSILDRYQAQAPQESAAIGPIDWAHPPAGERVDSMAAAARSLSFEPVQPQDLGSPEIFVDRGFGELALVYDHAADATVWQWATYWVTERPAGSTTTSVLRAIANQCVAKGGCEASAKMIPLRDGHEGLLIAGAATTGLIWVDGGVYFDVLLSPGGMSGIVAQSVANRTILATE